MHCHGGEAAVGRFDYSSGGVKQITKACSHRRHGQDKTVLSCLVRVSSVNKL